MKTKQIDFSKMNGLVPAIVQDARTKTVLMLGFMNSEAYEKTIVTKKVTFYSKLEGEHAPKYIKVDGTQPVEAVKAEVLGALDK